MSQSNPTGSVKMAVRLDQLFLSMTNPRHEAVDGEPEAIERLCRTEDVDALARDIALHGTNPAERLILFPVDETEEPGDDTSYYVAEGNRRVCALKLLNDPDLAPAKIRDSIIASAAGWTPPVELDAVVIRDETNRNLWLARIHDGAQGVRGRKSWNAEQKTRFFGGNRNVLAQALLDYAERKGMLAAEDRKGRISHFSRLLSNELVKDALGVEGSSSSDDPMRNRPEKDFDNVLRALLDEAGTKSLGSQVRKPEINDYARNILQKLEGVSGERVEAEPLIMVEAEKDEEPARSKGKPPKPKGAVNIKHNDEIAELLQAIGADKLVSLYHSICTINVAPHTPLLAVGAWTFFECLSGSMGRKDSQAFKDFYQKSRLEALGVGTGRELQAPLKAIERIADAGNITKHHKCAANFHAPQLINDMDTLRPVILASLKEIVKNG